MRHERLNRHELDIEIDPYLLKLIGSEAGKGLGNMPPRFSQFYWEDLSRFREYMGGDVDPLLHGAYQAKEIAIPMIMRQNTDESGRYAPFTNGEAQMLVIAHVLHDAHEYLVGDTPATEKTRESDEAELIVAREVLTDVVGDRFFAEQIVNIMGDFDGETFIGRAFKAGEWAGYLNTGFKAYALRHHPELTGEEQFQSEKMGGLVADYAAAHLVDYATEFPYANDLLVQYEGMQI